MSLFAIVVIAPRLVSLFTVVVVVAAASAIKSTGSAATVSVIAR